jgi:hypothetical protein
MAIRTVLYFIVHLLISVPDLTGTGCACRVKATPAIMGQNFLTGAGYPCPPAGFRIDFYPDIFLLDLQNLFQKLYLMSSIIVSCRYAWSGQYR